MNARKLLVSVLMLVSVLFSACAPAATPLAPTTVPPTADPTTVAPTAVLSVTPPAAPVLAEWKVNNPSFIAFGFGSVWITDHHGHNITRIDPVSNKVIAVIQGTGSNPEQALEVGDLLWVTGQDNDMTLIDPKTNTITKTVNGHNLFMAYGFNSVWITTRENTLDRFDPATAEVIASISLENGNSDCMNDVVVTPAAVWVRQCDKAELIKVDPATNSVVSKTPYATLIDEAKAQTQVPVGKSTDFIWISVSGDEGGGVLPSGLLRINPITGSGLTFLPLNPEHTCGGFLAVTDEAIWLCSIGGQIGQINRVNVATNQIDTTYTTAPGYYIKIGIGFGSVWLRNYEKNLVQRLDVTP